MLRKVRISMKVKILGLLVGLLAISSATYLWFALDMFSSDKSAYIYETGLSTAESLSAHVTGLFEKTAQNSYTLAVTGSGSKKKLRQVLEMDDNLLMFSVLQRKKGRIQEVLRAVNSKMIENFLEEYEVDRQYYDQITSADYFQVNRLKDKLYVVYDVTTLFKIPSVILLLTTQEQNEFYVSVLNLNKLISQFGKDQIYSNYLLGLKGESYVSSNPEVGQQQYVKDILAQEMSQGTKEIVDTNGDKKIVAYNKLLNYEMMVLTEISKDKAFLASKHLIKKSVFFGLMLLGLAIFVGVLFSISITNPIKALLFGTQQVAQGNFKEKTNVKTNDELGVLSDSFNFMSGEIERLMEQTAQKARMEKELETAHTVQETLFPELSATYDNVQIAGHYHPASECGGDWWYYSQMGDRVFYWIGDATGHGVPAALITSAARSAASIIENFPDINPGKALSLLNNAICDTSKGKMFMTFFLASFDKKTSKLTYANASQNPPFLFKFKDPDLKVKSFIPLAEVNGPRLGQERGASYQEYVVELKPDDTILFYTDGVTELENAEGKLWGERKFLKAVIAGIQASASPEEVITYITKEIDEYRGGAEYNDDVTMFMTRINA